MIDKFKDIPVDDSWMVRAELYANNKKFYATNTEIWIKALSKVRQQKNDTKRTANTV
jgi:hypothetical protein